MTHREPWRVSTKNGLDSKHRKGGDIDEWPADLRIRQFPEVA